MVGKTENSGFTGSDVEKAVSGWVNAPEASVLVETSKKYGHFRLQEDLDSVGGLELSEKIKKRREVMKVKRVGAMVDFDEVFVDKEYALSSWSFQGVIRSSADLIREGIKAKLRLTPSGEGKLGTIVQPSAYKDDIEANYYNIVHGDSANPGVELNPNFLEFCREYKPLKDAATRESDPLNVVILSRNKSYIIKATVQKYAKQLASEGIVVDGIIANEFDYQKVEVDGEERMRRVFPDVTEVTTPIKPDYDPDFVPYLVDNEEFGVLGDKVNAFNVQHKGDVDYHKLFLGIEGKRDAAVAQKDIIERYNSVIEFYNKTFHTAYNAFELLQSTRPNAILGTEVGEELLAFEGLRQDAINNLKLLGKKKEKWEEVKKQSYTPLEDSFRRMARKALLAFIRSKSN